jgi:dihydrodipicolinate synthase/N-acetylneuraminate lyase
VTPITTPFDPDDNIDFSALRRNILRLSQTPLSGFVLGTENDEELTLSEDEKTRIVETVCEANAGDKLVIAGVDVPATKEALRLAGKYAEAGADYIRVRTPRGMSASALQQYYKDVVGECPKPVLIMHQTFSETAAAPPEVLGSLSQLDNVAGYIGCNLQVEPRVRSLVPDDRCFWFCTGSHLLYGMLMGANGVCTLMGNVVPDLCMRIVTLGMENRFAEAQDSQIKAERLYFAMRQHGIAGLKAALRILGHEGQRPRSPWAELGRHGTQEIESIMRDIGLVQ